MMKLVQHPRPPNDQAFRYLYQSIQGLHKFSCKGRGWLLVHTMLAITRHARWPIINVVSVLRRFSARYFGICQFFLWYCSILGTPVWTVECSAMEESEKKITRRKRRRKGRDESGNACEICFQKVIPPTLSANNLNVVSRIKSCQSSNERHTALFTEF